jgi:hypothetical protein
VTDAEISTHSALGQTLNSLLAEARGEARLATKAASRWDRLGLALGLPSALLAGVAGAAGLATTAGRVPAAIMSLCVAALAGVGSFLNCDKRANEARRRAAMWQSVVTDGCLLAAFEGSRAPAFTIRNQIALLVARIEAIRVGDFDLVAESRNLGAGRIVELEADGRRASCAMCLHLSNWVDIHDCHDRDMLARSCTCPH